MPIYAYRCSHCGHAQDVLQKMSDAPLTQCPACGQNAYVKQLTAAGFQLKGSGWYETDFSGRKSSAPAADSTPTAAPTEAGAAVKAPETTKTEAPAAALASAKATSEA